MSERHFAQTAADRPEPGCVDANRPEPHLPEPPRATIEVRGFRLPFQSDRSFSAMARRAS